MAMDLKEGSLERTRTVVQLVGTLARTCPRRLGRRLPEFMPRVISTTEQDDDELREVCLQVSFRLHSQSAGGIFTRVVFRRIDNGIHLAALPDRSHAFCERHRGSRRHSHQTRPCKLHDWSVCCASSFHEQCFSACRIMLPTTTKMTRWKRQTMRMRMTTSSTKSKP